MFICQGLIFEVEKKSQNSNFLKYFSQEKKNCEKFAIKIKA